MIPGSMVNLDMFPLKITDFQEESHLFTTMIIQIGEQAVMIMSYHRKLKGTVLVPSGFKYISFHVDDVSCPV